MSILAFVRRVRVQESLSFLLINALLVLSLPLPSRAQVATAISDGNEDKGQVRKEMPHKNLPSLTDLQDEAKGIQKVKAKDTPPQPAKLCRLRDVDCLAKQKATGGQIGANLPFAEGDNATPAPNTTKSSGSWLQRLKKKVSGALTGGIASAFTTTSPGGNSFVPTNTKVAAVAPSPMFTPPAFATLNEAKLDAHNRIGTGSEDLFSGNLHWSTPLVSLPGRNGLDLNLTLHYNSLQWVKFNGTMYFDPDWKTSYPVGLSNGFNLGFPEIESGYVYKTTATDTTPAYVVTLPSGYRVPLRRVYLNGSQQRYEAVDGSNLYYTFQSGQSPTLYLPDGTQYVYAGPSFNGAGARCSLIKDSNGNKITITYNSIGISTITDTLGRVLNFTYDANFHLYQITQNWNGSTHVWAQFDYSTKLLNYNFPGATIDGPANNTNLSVLSRVITSDGARHTFVYNGWGIAEDFFTYGEADNQRAFLDYGFPAPGPMYDCPRFGQRDDNIFGWSGAVYNATTGFGRVSNYFTFDPSETYGQVQTPDGVVHKELFDTTGGTRGLTTGTETIVGGVKRKWTTATWVSDSTTNPYYPRVTETNIYDDWDGNNSVDNQRRTTLTYTQFTKTAAQSTMPYTVYLPTQTTEYQADASTVYRYTQTDYLDDTNYWNRRIIGLTTEQRLYDGGGTLQAKSAYSYDQLGLASFPTTPVQFDGTNYGIGMIWRGNLTNTKRYSVVSGTAGSYTETKAYYFLTGSVADTYDAMNRHTLFDYQDSFATYADDANNTETLKTLTTKAYAYPTLIQDPGGYSSTLKYWYDTGAPTKTVNPKGAAAISIYEGTHGRLQKAKNLVNSAYTRYIYATDHNSAQSLTTVNSTSVETSNISVFDGIGRTRVQVGEHPGSAGGSKSSYQVFDIMGRISEWSNPTEIDNTWAPFGDDVSGYKYSRQEYDWKGRPTITYNQDYDAATNPNSKRQISYTGCGCAGGQVTTVTDEMGRMQKAYADFLGRTFKTEIYNGTSVYKTNTTTLNVRDQSLQVQELANASSATQNTTFSYDGYGRLWKSRKPIETADTTYLYFDDDQVQSMTDARGAISTYTYDNRGLLSGKSYTLGTSGASATSSVTYQYNELGQRTFMDDGPGSVVYAYNTLGQLTSETRTFDNVALPGAPTTPFTINYGNYNLAGQVGKITDPFNDAVNYTYDKTGRLASVTGDTSFAGIANYPYLSSVNYRAWGGIKNGRSYDMRMRIINYTGFGGINYQYDLSSKLTYAQMLGNEAYHQSFSYDGLGRLTNVSTPAITVPSEYVQTQSAPPNGLPSGFTMKPFDASLTYDEFGNMTARTNKYWYDWTTSNHPSQTFATTYENGRAKKDGVAGRVATNNTNQTWTYNNAGEVTNDTSVTQQYDAAGSLTHTQQITDANVYYDHAHDGDGQQVKFEQKLVNGFYSGGYEVVTRYRVFSSVTGRLLTEIDSAGQKIETHLYVLDNAEYRQMKAYSIKISGTQYNNYAEQVVQEYTDPHSTRAYQWDRQTNTYKTLHTSPAGVYNEAINWSDLKNRFINNVAGQMSYAQVQAHYPGTRSQLEDPTNPGRGCELDGKSVSCSKLRQGLTSGAYDLDPQMLQDEKALWEYGFHTHREKITLSGAGPKKTWIDTVIDSDASAGINLDELETSIDGPGGSQYQSEGQRKQCEGIAATIKNIIDGYWKTARTGAKEYVKGLTQRYEEQVGSPSTNGPGTDIWKGHQEQIDGRRGVLRESLKKWDKNGCGPRPPGTTELLSASNEFNATQEWNRRQTRSRINPEPPVVIPLRPPIPNGRPVIQTITIPLIAIPSIILQFLRRSTKINNADDSTD